MFPKVPTLRKDLLIVFPIANVSLLLIVCIGGKHYMILIGTTFFFLLDSPQDCASTVTKVEILMLPSIQ